MFLHFIDTNLAKTRSLKRPSIDNQSTYPPRKRSRRDNNLNFNNYNNRDRESGDHQIWGRSDTNLLSFDINKLDSFLIKFEGKVLNGAELQDMPPSEHINFLNKRCKEFVKILTELKGYVIHLRVCYFFCYIYL